MSRKRKSEKVSPIGKHCTTKKLYSHPMRWEPALVTNTVQIRAKFAQSSHKPQEQWSTELFAHLHEITRNSRHDQDSGRPRCKLQWLKRPFAGRHYGDAVPVEVPDPWAAGGWGGFGGSSKAGLVAASTRVFPGTASRHRQGSLKARHHRREGRPVPLGKQQARGGGHC